MHIPSSTVTAAPKLRMGNSTGWQHPEAWLGSVTSIQGNSRLDEEAWKFLAASFPFGCVTVRGRFAAACRHMLSGNIEGAHQYPTHV